MDQDRVLDNHISTLRKNLTKSILQNADTTQNIFPLLHLCCPLNKKYEILDMIGLLQKNSQSLEQLKQIGVAMSILEKYGRHLMKGPENRSELWRYVKFNNPIFKDRVDTLKGGRDIMRQMGYTIDIQDGLAFPENTEPDQDRLLRLVTDILLGRKELEVFLQGHHPRRDDILHLMPSDAINSLNEMWNKSSEALLSQAILSQQIAMNLQGQDTQKEGNSLVCDICGHKFPELICPVCDNKQLCKGCDDKWHNHPKRQQHHRQRIPQSTAASEEQTQPLGKTVTNLKQVGISVPAYRQGGILPSSGFSSESSLAQTMRRGVIVPSHLSSFESNLAQTMRAPVSTSTNLPLSGPAMGIASQYVPLSAASAQAEISWPPSQGLAFSSKSPQQTPIELGVMTDINHTKNLQDDRIGSIAPQNKAAINTSPNQLLPQHDNKLLHKSDSDDSYHSANDYLETSSPDKHQSIGHYVASLSRVQGPSSTASINSSKPATINRSTSKLMPSILAIPDLAKRKSKIEINLITLAEEMEELESRITAIIASNQGFYEDDEFITLNRKKGTLYREKIQLEQYLSELNEPVMSQPELHSPAIGSGDSNDQFTAMPTIPVASAVPVLDPPDVSSTSQSPTMGPDVLPENQKLKLSMQNINDAILSQGQMKNQPNIYEEIKFPPSSIYMMNPNCVTDLSVAAFSDEHVPGMSQNKGSLQQERVEDSWVCQHCTFHNKLGTDICSMCSKTTDHLGPGKTSAITHSPVRTEYAGSLTIAYIEEDQDKVYMEKQEAHRLHQEQILKEQEAQKGDHYHPQQGFLGYVKSKFKPASHLSNAACELSAGSHDETVIIPPQLVIQDQLHPGPQSVTSNSKQNLPKLTPFNSTSIEQLNHASELSKQFVNSLESIKERRGIEQLGLDGSKLISLIKNAEREGFEIDEIELALVLADQDNMSPIEWLHKKWRNMFETVVAMTVEEGQNMAQNDVGQISVEEAKAALTERQGDVKAAIEYCVEKRKKQFAEIMSYGNFAREDILHNLFVNQDVESSLDCLNNTVLQPYVDRLWQLEDQNPSRSQALHEVEVEVQAVAIDVCNSFSNSVVKYEDFQHTVRNKEIDTERRIRMILVEGKLQGWGRAETVIKILDQDLNALNYPECTLEDIIEAVRNCDGSRPASLVYLSQQCQICYSNYPMSKIRYLSTCSCKLCVDCVKSYFEIAIREKHVRNWTCPNCQLPDLEDEQKSEAYLTFLDMLLRTFVEPDIMELFGEKLTNWHLQRDPKFRWCTHCGNGSLWEAGEQNLAMTCPHCRKKTCFKCKKQWDKQHEGVTCEKYEQWKIDNDPDNQAQGLARHLEANGIDCPKCQMRFDLARGGCIHFTCPECGHQFCSGCFNPFFGNNSHSKGCKSKGLHCHHPRDCFYYLRDYDVADLKKLLRENYVQFNETIPQDQQDQHHCPVMEQKENEFSKKKDEPCGRVVETGCAGLCCSHYKEYLVGIINKSKLDPVFIMTDEELKIFMKRQGKRAKYPEDKHKLIQLIIKDYPLTKKV